MELDKQKQGTPTKQPYSTSKEGIGNIHTVSYEDLTGKTCDVFHESCNSPKNVKTAINGGKKLGTPALGAGRI